MLKEVPDSERSKLYQDENTPIAQAYEWGKTYFEELIGNELILRGFDDTNLLDPTYLKTFAPLWNEYWYNNSGTYNGEVVNYTSLCTRLGNGECESPFDVYRVWGYDPTMIPDEFLLIVLWYAIKYFLVFP